MLSSHTAIEKAADYEVTEKWLGKGLLTNGGESWHRQRKLLTPSFHFKILSTFKEPMEECCATMVAKLRPLADGERVIDVYPFVSLMALDVICGEWTTPLPGYASFCNASNSQRLRWALKSTRS